MKQVFNPYLPQWEYIPDGEPRVFEGRVYVYGSHDRFGAPIFCVEDYVCWSAPVEDLTDWRYEGVIYRKNQDPKNKLGLRLLFAPDAVRGPDGRYYLYYAFDFMGIIGVAVCDTPAGKYEFLGHVRYPDGTVWGRKPGDQFPFDPGVLVDGERIYLYSGFGISVPALFTGLRKLQNDGVAVAELEQDMVTLKTDPRVMIPAQGAEGFENHEFFEASSIRKDGDRYIFVYSSRHNHELCWAYSHRPDGDFRFGGTLVSQGDLFLDGRTEEKDGRNYLGNTHGGMLYLGSDWYVFYHRQTNRHSYSRQACAERLRCTPEGRFLQAEVTSCGLNGGPLTGRGTYPAYITCNLWSKDGVGRYDGSAPGKRLSAHPYLTQKGKGTNGQQFIANMRNGSVAGYKYFDFQQLSAICVTVNAKGTGTLQVSTEPDFSSIAASLPVKETGGRTGLEGTCAVSDGVRALYFRYCGEGSVDLYDFTLL